MDKKKLLALLIFLIMGFFMVSFANPSEELRPVATDTKEETPTNNDANQTNVNPTRNTTNVNRGSQTIVTPVQPQDTTPVTDPTNDGIGNVDVAEYTVIFVDYANNVLKSQTVEEHSSANADDINVNDYTVAGITYSFTKWDKDFSDVTQNLTVKALYDVEKIIAHVYINGEKTDDTVEIKVNDDTKNQKDVKLTDDNIDDYIVNKDELPEVKDGKENEIDKLTFDEEEGYIVEINEEFIDYNVRAFDGALVEKVEAIKAHMGDEVKLSHKDKKGYTFKYYIVIENNNRVTFEKEDTTITVHTSDIDVYAFYEVNTYEITYELDGGSTTNVTTYTVEDEVELSDATKTGYNFTKWTENGKTITKIAKGSTGNKTITAHYEAREDIEYTVEFYKENLTYENGKYSFVEKETRNNGVADKENTIAVNKTYTGFKTPAAKKVVIAADGSTVVQFYFDREEYTVTFKNFDITNLNRVLEEKVKYEAAAQNAPTLTNNDDYNGYKYTFNGWDKEFSYITGNTVVTANLTKEINTYTINYVIDNLTTTTNATSYTVKDEVVFTDAVKKGYDFIKWTDENGQTIKKIAKGSTGNRTITAHFEASTNTKYTVKVYKEKLDYQSAEDRYAVTSNEYYDGITDTNKTITAPIFEGFTATIESLTKKIDAEGTTVYEFFYNRDIHTLTFKVDGEVYGNVQSLKYGQAIVVPTYTAAEGYTFHTWTNVAATMGTEDLVYNATTTANTNTKYTVIVNEENVDGTIKTTKEEKTGTTGTTVTVTKANKTGFVLDATSKDVTITGDGKAKVVFNYTRERHTLTFKVNGEVYGNVQTLKYGETITKPSYTVAEGYNFSGWTNVAATMGTEDLVYDATYAIKKFTVKWSVDGRIVETDENVEYGSKPKYDSATPAKASVTDESGYTYNYTYTGWKDLTDETVITSDKTFVAELVTLKATVKDNKQLSYTRESNVDVKDDIIVQVVDHAGNVVKTLTKSEYTTNFDNSELTYNNKKNLVINYTYKNKALTNNKLFYEVLRKAFNSKFEVKLSIGNSYRKTTDPNCTKDCDTQDNTDEVSLDHNILEVIEHYNQLVQVQSISANYGNGETALEFITKKDYYGRVKPSSVRWSDAVHYSNGNVEYYNPVYIAQKVGYDYSNTYVKDSKGGTVKHGQKYPDHSYVEHWLREDSDMTGKTCNDTNLLGKAVDCSYDYRYVARTNQTSGLYRIENNEFVSYKPSGYVNVDEEGHRIQTVTVYYHRNENLDEHETEGNFVVVFEYDRVLNKFVCIDEHEVK